MRSFDKEAHIYIHLLMYEYLPAHLGVVMASGVGALLASLFDTSTCQTLGLDTGLRNQACSSSTGIGGATCAATRSNRSPYLHNPASGEVR